MMVRRSLDEYVGTAEAARMIGVAIATAQHWFDQGKIGGVTVPKPNGVWRLLLRADVERLVKERAERK